MLDHGSRRTHLTLPIMPGTAGHVVHFYESDTSLAQTVGAYLGEGLVRGEGLIVIATREHWAAFRRRLTDEGAPLDEATRSGRVVVLDATQALSCILVGGAPDDGAFHNVVSAAFNMVADRAPRVPVRAYGEMVDLLWRGNRVSHALTLEQLWNELLEERQSAELLCAYRMNRSHGQEHARDIDAICAAHAHVAPGGPYAKGPLEGSRPA
jgi:hypothetical protein